MKLIKNVKQRAFNKLGSLNILENFISNISALRRNLLKKKWTHKIHLKIIDVY